MDHVDLSVVIPLRDGDNPHTTLETLDYPCEVIVSMDGGKGANVARNNGFAKVRTPFVLFSDCDIRWRPGAIQRLRNTLDANPVAAYSFGSYLMDGKEVGGGTFDPNRLRANNYIPTMSMIRTDAFPGFDPEIERLQDWDLWLTMLEQGKHGAGCGEVVFETDKRRGISFVKSISWTMARGIVARKHGLA